MKKLIVIASVVLVTLIYSDAFSQVRPPLPPHPPHPHYYSNKYYRTHPQRVVVINLPPIVL